MKSLLGKGWLGSLLLMLVMFGTARAAFYPCEEITEVSVSSNDQYGSSINELGEIVWSERDPVIGFIQIYSSTRGQLTSDAYDHNSPSINNYGDVVWEQHDPVGGTTTIHGIISGTPVQVSYGNIDRQPAINDAGEIVYIRDDHEVVSTTRGQLAYDMIYYFGSTDLNNNGDVVWSQNDATGYFQIYLLQYNSVTPVAVTSDATFHDFPTINDSGEIVWSQDMGGMVRLMSSTRGQLTDTCPAADHWEADLNNCGDLVMLAMGAATKTVYKVGINGACISPPTGGGSCEGLSAVSPSAEPQYGSSINELGEIVWAEFDPVSGYTQIYSSTRGQLTTDAYEHNSPSINNYGDVVWEQHDPVGGTSAIHGIISGTPTQVSYGSSDRQPAINDAGEIVYIRDGHEVASTSRGSLAYDMTYNFGSTDLNNNGDVVWSQSDATGYFQIYQLLYNSGTPVAVTSDSTMHDFPTISDSGEIVWSQDMGGMVRLMSSTRGQLTDSCPVGTDHWEPDLNACGDVVFAAFNPAIGKGEIYLLGDGVACISPPTGGGSCDGLSAVSPSAEPQYGSSINELGEIVWSEFDPVSGYTQIYSSTRGQLTTDAYEHNSPSINNYGDVVWEQHDPVGGTSAIHGIISGTPTQVSYGSSDRQPAINDAGEIVYIRDGHEVVSTSRGSLAYDMTYYFGSTDLNNNGDVVWSQSDATGYFQIYQLLYNSGTPVAVTSGPTFHDFPTINDSGEIVWTQDMGGLVRLMSSTRGQLTDTCPAGADHWEPDLNACGDVVFAAFNPAVGKAEVYLLGDGVPCISPPTGGGACEGLSAVSPSAESQYGSSINALGEIVWSEFDPVSGFIQIYSSTRGQLTTDAYEHNSPSINNYGDVVWEQRDPVGGATAIHGIFSGTPAQLSYGSSDRQPAINDAGEIVYIRDGHEVVSTSRGTLAYDMTYYFGSTDLNNNGDVVWSQDDATGYMQIYQLLYNSGTPVAVTSGPTFHDFPTINDSGEIVWTQDMGGLVRLMSSTRGQLTDTCPAGADHWEPDLNACGDVVFAAFNPAIGKGEVYLLGDGQSCYVDTLPPNLTITPVASPRSTDNFLLTGTTESGASIVVTVDTGATVGQVTFTSATEWECPISGLYEGLNVLTVTATDAAANSKAEQVSVELDTIAPSVSLSSPTAGLTGDNAPLLTYTFSDGAVDVTIDGGAVSTRSGEYLEPLTDGEHTVRVTATDAAANSANDEVTITVDATPPTVSLLSPVSGSTSDSTPLLDYSVSDGAVTVLVDGVPVAKSAGELLDALADGVHSVRVESTDTAGNLGIAEVTFTVDTVAPTVSLTAPVAGLTNDNTPLLSYSVSDGVVTVLVDGVPVAKTSGDQLDGLAEGPHTVRVESIDTAGNSAYDEETFTVDTVAPTVGIDAVTTPTNIDAQTLTGTMETGATVVVSVDTAAVVGTVIYPTATTWSCNLSSLAEGSNVVTATATDAAGNSAGGQATIVLDTTPPTVGINFPTSFDTNDTTPYLSYSVSDGTVVVKVDDVVVSKVNGDSLDTLADGPHTVRVEATDVVGNSSYDEVTFTVDTVAPIVTMTSPVTGLTNDATPILNYSVSDGTVTVYVDGAPVAKQSGEQLDVLTDGLHIVRVESVDSASNTGFHEMSVDIDTSAPERLISAKTSAATSGTFVIGNDGSLWGWGSNYAGRIGDGTAGSNKLAPVQVGQDTDWAQIASGSMHTIALKKDGTLWAWGDNDYGQLGDGSTVDKVTPVQVGTDNDWASIAVGNFQSFAIKADASLWGWGKNSEGQLGEGTTFDRNVPVQIGAGNSWVAVDSGHDHTLALRSDGSLWAWGNNSEGQLGIGGFTNQYIAVQIGGYDWTSFAAAHQHSFAVRADGSLWAWGSNYFGELGRGNYSRSTVPARVGVDNDWAQVSGQYSHTLGVKTDGTLWAWGCNNGQLGDGTTNDSNVPIQVGVENSWMSISAGYYHSVALKNDKSLWLWGENLYGQIGNGGSNIQQLSPLNVEISKGVVVINDGNTYTASEVVTIELTAADTAGVAEMQFSDDAVSWSTVEPYATSRVWTLPGGDGVKTVYARFKDNAGNWSGSFSDTIELDTLTPSVTLTAPAAGMTNDNTPLLTYSVSDGNVVLKVDNVVVPKVSGDSLDSLSEGVHTVRVEATDAAGNLDSAEVTFTVDTIAPTVNLTAPAADITNDNTPLLTYSVNDGTVTVLVDGVPVAKISGDLLDVLTDGNHLVRVESIDAAGNSAFDEVTFTVDTAAPEVGIDTVASPTNVNTQTVIGTMEAGATVTVSVDTAAIAGSVTYPTATTWSSDISGLVEGINVITATATDAADNSAAAQATIELDTLAPTISLSSPTTGITNDNSPLLTYSVSDGTVTVLVDGLPVAKTSGDLLDALADGAHTVLVESVDTAGNLGSAEVTFTVDTIAPTVSLTAPTSGITNDNSPLLTYNVSDGSVVVKVDNIAVSKVSGDSLDVLNDGAHAVRVEATDTAGNLAYAEVTFTVDTVAPAVGVDAVLRPTNIDTQIVTGTMEAGAMVAVMVDTSAAVGIVTYPTATSWSCEINDLMEGANGITVTATDAAGNNAAAVTTVTLDTVVPTVSIASPAATLTNDNQPLLTFVVNDESAVIAVKVDGVLVNKVLGETLEALSDGMHTVRVEAIDTASNTGFAEVTFTVDTLPPAVGIDPVTTPTNADAQTITGTVEAGATVTVSATTAAAVGPLTYPTATTWSCDISGLAEGINNINVTAFDAADNSATAGTTITLDTVAPTVSIASPSAALTNDNQPLLTYQIDDTAVIVVKVDGVLVDKVSSETLDTLFEGTHTLRVEATDAASNTGFAEVTFTVDTLPPAVGLDPVATPTNSDAQTITGSREADAAVTVSADTAATVGPVTYPTATTWSCAISGLAEGVNNITAMATDAAGNSTYEQTMIELDTVAPTISLISPVSGSTNDNTPPLIYSVSDGSVVVIIDGVAVSKVSGDRLDALTDGVHNVRIEATDSVNNVGSAEVSFTIDTIAPALTVNPVNSPTKNTSQTLTGTMEPGATITVSVDTNATVGEVSYPTASTWSCDISGLASGLNNFTIVAYDQAGNSASESAVIKANVH